MCARSFAGSGRYHRVERSGSARAGVPTERQTSDPKTNNLSGSWILGTLKLTKKSGDSCTWNSEKKTIRWFLYLELHHVWSACLEPYAVEKLFATKYYWKSEYQSTIIVSNQNTVDNVLFSTYHCVLAKIRNLSGFLGDCCTHWNRLRWRFSFH